MGIVFQPWVGPEYAQGLSGLRLLVLGESHYLPPGVPLSSGFTTEVIRQHAIAPERSLRFFTKTAKLILGRADLPVDVRLDFWNRVAFYNYIQESVGVKARQRPTPEMWKRSQDAFFEALDTLRPHGVVVLGKELWQNLPSPAEYSTSPVEMRAYEAGSWRTVATYSTHPSGRGFAYATWMPRIALLLNEARKFVRH